MFGTPFSDLLDHSQTYLGVHMRFWLQAHLLAISMLVPGLLTITDFLAGTAMQKQVWILPLAGAVISLQVAQLSYQIFIRVLFEPAC